MQAVKQTVMPGDFPLRLPLPRQGGRERANGNVPMGTCKSGSSISNIGKTFLNTQESTQ